MTSEFIIALHSLVLLAYCPDHMATSETIADNVCTHPARIRKIMSCLRKQGLVTTKEGTGGGYILSCNANKVSLAQIYRITSEGSMKPNWCSGDTTINCVVASNMKFAMEGIMDDAEGHVIAYLEGITVQDVLGKLKSTSEQQ